MTSSPGRINPPTRSRSIHFGTIRHGTFRSTRQISKKTPSSLSPRLFRFLWRSRASRRPTRPRVAPSRASTRPKMANSQPQPLPRLPHRRHSLSSVRSLLLPPLLSLAMKETVPTSNDRSITFGTGWKTKYIDLSASRRRSFC